jgi:hypothetical protein
MTIASILSNLGNTNRAAMVERLKQEKAAAQTGQFHSAGSQNNDLQKYINKLTGILAVIESGIKPAPHFLTEEEFQQLRSTVKRFVDADEFDEGQFNLLYGS